VTGTEPTRYAPRAPRPLLLPAFRDESDGGDLLADHYFPPRQLAVVGPTSPRVIPGRSILESRFPPPLPAAASDVVPLSDRNAHALTRSASVLVRRWLRIRRPQSVPREFNTARGAAPSAHRRCLRLRPSMKPVLPCGSDALSRDEILSHPDDRPGGLVDALIKAETRLHSGGRGRAAGVRIFASMAR